jgi:hypothetical protein
MNELDYTNNPYQDEAEQLYQFFLGTQTGYNRPADLMDYNRALQKVIHYREGTPEPISIEDKINAQMTNQQIADLMKTPIIPNDPINSRALRNVDHGLQSQVDSYGKSVLSRIARPIGYNLIKLLAQSHPVLGEYLDKNLTLPEQEDDPHPYTEASPPGLDSIWWGLRSFWGKN